MSNDEQGMRMAYLQGIADWFRYNTRCPVYWKGKPEADAWEDGYKYAKKYNEGAKSEQ